MKNRNRFIYQPGLPLGKDGKRVTGGTEHIALSREAAAEGMVLLKNEKAGSSACKRNKGSGIWQGLRGLCKRRRRKRRCDSGVRPEPAGCSAQEGG